MDFRTKKVSSVDAYIKAAPKESQAKLKQIRAIIKSVAPHAEEKMSYGMPYYSYKGRLVYFAAAKKHIGLYPMPPIVDMYEDELKKYQTSKATIRFPLNEKLPVALIKKLLKVRIKMNEKAKK